MSNKFKVGDRVRCVMRNLPAIRYGETGTVSDVDYLFDMIDVEWDISDSERHDCGGMCEDGHRRYVCADELDFLHNSNDCQCNLNVLDVEDLFV